MGECPLCGFKEDDDYALALHVEEKHFAEDSPFVAKQDDAVAEPLETPTSDQVGDNPWILCEEVACGEHVLFSDYAEHLSFHICENLEIDSDESSEASSTPNMSGTGDFSDQPHSIFSIAEHATHKSFSPPRALSTLEQRDSHNQVPLDAVNVGSNQKLGLSRTISPRDNQRQKGIRLGRRELGPYAFEERMPSWLLRQLEQGAKSNTIQTIGPNGRLVRHISVENEVAGIVPVLSRLLEIDCSVEKAYLCHPAVKHIFKTKNEGGFCGYRNVQMMMSYMLGSDHPDVERINGLMKESWRGTGRVPNVLDIQRAIEHAWDRGFGVNCKLETGGIIETRKYIGTPEVTTMLSSLSIPHDSDLFTDASNDSRSRLACDSLLQGVMSYFEQSSSKSLSNVVETQLPPIYFQMPGHSLTIVGVEQRKDGETNLLVLDPAFKPSKEMYKLLNKPPPRQSGSDSVRSSRSNSVASSHSTNIRQTSLVSPRGGEASKRAASSELHGDSRQIKHVLLKPQPSSSSTRSMFGNPKSISSSNASRILDTYRRGKAKLKRHAQFEICVLSV